MSDDNIPYRFVPLSPLILIPDWGPQVSHDLPFEDGLSGELRITLTNHTPLCIGSGKTDPTNHVLPFAAPDGQFVIPGSSLKGMLRNVMEIATFGRFSRVDNPELNLTGREDKPDIHKGLVHALIQRTQRAHLDPAAGADLADLIFGHIHEQISLRGRVSCGDLRHDYEQPVTLETYSFLLLSPRPHFAPAHLQQQTGRYNSKYTDPNARLAGWKRYVPQRKDEIQSQQGNGTDVISTLKALPKNERFTGYIRFHNLRNVELGALLWCLNFGGRQGARHVMGMGKSVGMGQVSLDVEIEKCRFRHNLPGLATRDTENQEIIRFARASFRDFMDRVVLEAGLTGQWSGTNTIKALCEHAMPIQPKQGISRSDIRRPKRDSHDSFHDMPDKPSKTLTQPLRVDAPTSHLKVRQEDVVPEPSSFLDPLEWQRYDMERKRSELNDADGKTARERANKAWLESLKALEALAADMPLDPAVWRELLAFAHPSESPVATKKRRQLLKHMDDKP